MESTSVLIESEIRPLAQSSRSEFDRMRLTLLAGIVAALAYSSWPLGYLLNHAVAVAGLASDLESRGQPFAWLFIGLDVVTGLATLVVAAAARGPRWRLDRRKQWAPIALYVVFGAATAIDALIPLRCGNALSGACGANLNQVSVDDIVTGIADLALFGSGVLAAIVGVRSFRGLTSVVLAVVVAAWSVCGLALLASHFSQHPPILLQHLLLTLSSVLLVGVPAVLFTSRQSIEAARSTA